MIAKCAKCNDYLSYSRQEPGTINDTILIEPCSCQLHQERERAERAERERDELRKALHSLLWEAECFEEMSKHLMRECEEARRVLGGE